MKLTVFTNSSDLSPTLAIIRGQLRSLPFMLNRSYTVGGSVWHPDRQQQGRLLQILEDLTEHQVMLIELALAGYL